MLKTPITKVKRIGSDIESLYCPGDYSVKICVNPSLNVLFHVKRVWRYKRGNPDP